MHILRGKVLNFPICFTRSLPKPRNSSLRLRSTTNTSNSEAMTPIEEADVGISCYASQIPGFRGILKHRYSDFMVHEVDCDGSVVHLTCCDASPEKVAFGISDSMAQEERSHVCDSEDEKYTLQVESFKSLAGDANAAALKGLLDQINSGVMENLSPIILAPDPDKSHRTAVHNFFKENFKFLVTDTVEGPDNLLKCVRVRFCSREQCGNGRNSKKRKNGKHTDLKEKRVCSSFEGGSLQPFDSRGAEDWPEGSSKFLRFHLYKENKDTQEALGVIGKMLGIQLRSFGFAGTKDKRAITTQRVTVFKVLSKRLAALNNRLIGIKVGDFCYVKEGLVLGQLFGNRFTITLRGIVADSEDYIISAADELGRNGFINYFGLQRFGSGSVPTHVIGASLLRGEWKAAVGLILDPREGERNAIAEAREYLKESADIDGTLRRLPRHMVAERAILQCLKKCPGNYLQALKAIPRTLRMMYVHSYQSYLWNHAASSRVQTLGITKVVAGDLVYCKGDSSDRVAEVVNTECEDDSFNDDYEFNSPSAMSEIELPEEKIHVVKALNAEDLLSGEYTFNDVILPLPGSRVIYPTNDVANVYHDLAKKDGISLTESCHNVKEFSITAMTGGYRRVFQRPIDFGWELLKYTDPNIPLSKTDFDIITESRPQNVIKEMGPPNGVNPETPRNCLDQLEILNNERTDSSACYDAKGECEEGVARLQPISSSGSQIPQTALKLCFTLPSSCYATMAIRELLKTSTSVAFQKTLTG